VSEAKYSTRFTQDARAELRAVEKTMAQRILAKLTELESDPFGFATSELVGEPGVRRLRVGDYRVFYRVDRGQLLVVVVRVGHRSVVYDT
jgi:mRNA interferase RelE/StbE